MKHTLTAMAAAATLAASLAGSTTEASAQRGFWAGAAIGTVGGVLLGTAIANSRPAYVVEPAPVVVGPRTCVVEQQVWSNRYQAWVVRPVRVAC
jgi:hypothetical protein